MENLKKYIYEQVAKKMLSKEDAKRLLLEIKDKNSGIKEEIAIIGVSCKLPGAKNPQEYWENIESGKVCIGELSKQRKKDNEILFEDSVIQFLAGRTIQKEERDKEFIIAGFLEEIDKFDAGFFKIGPKEATYMDPYQRLLLENVWETIEDAGYCKEDIYGSKTGVFIGKDYTPMSLYKFITKTDAMHLTGSWTGILASRISYIFNLRGPSMVIDTACSSGLVSIHKACEALRTSECDMAIAGGINLNFTPIKTISTSYDMVMVESDGGSVRPFDSKASGTVWGEGVCTVLLKPLKKALKDGDNIYAVIKGSGINNDGKSNGLTAPSVEAQEEVITRVWRESKINPETISYTEAHGTGTLLGDPVEIKGLTNSFRRFTDRKQFCSIGTVKPSIGHTVAASGIAGLIKVILAMKNKKIPASLNFDEPNPYINFTESPVYVNDKTREWETGDIPRRAGVSSFGFSGTNCYILLEEPRVSQSDKKYESSVSNHIITLSGKSKRVMRELIENYQKYLSRDIKIDISDICYTANTGRGHYNYRIALIVKDIDDLRKKIELLLERESFEEYDDIFVGSFSIVSVNKKNRDNNEFTDIEIMEKSKIFNNSLSKYNNEEILNVIGENYVNGIDIDWKLLYKDKKLKKVSIPVYPFERKRYWAEIKSFNNINKQEKSTGVLINKKMVDKHIIDTKDERIYTTELNPDKHWALKEHKIEDIYLLPGTALLEMVIEAYYDFTGSYNVKIESMNFLNAIVVKNDSDKEVHIILKREGDSVRFEVISNSSESSRELIGIEVVQNWVTHTEGCLVPNQSNESSIINVNELRNNCNINEILVTPEFFNGTLNMGKRWMNAKKIYQGENELFVELEVQDEFEKDVSEFILYPSIMDNALNIVSQGIDEGTYLPWTYKNMKIYSRIPKKCYSHIKMLDSTDINLGIIEFQAVMMDQDGNKLVEIENYKLKKVKIEDLKQKNSNQNNIYHSIKWVGSEITSQEKDFNSGDILIIKNKNKPIIDELIAKLKGEGKNIIEVEISEKYNRISDKEYTVNNFVDHFTCLFNDLEKYNISEIIHCISIDEIYNPYNVNDIEALINNGAINLFNIVKSINSLKFKSKISITIITSYANKVLNDELNINPINAALCSMGNVINNEFDNIKCRSIDIDKYTEAEDILLELYNKDELKTISYRNRKRYVEEFGDIDVDKLCENKVEYTDDDIFIVTGGLGGIGLKISMYLSSKCKANIVLISRTTMPAKEEWDNILLENTNERLCEKIKVIRDIEESGSNVYCYSADVTNMDQIKRVLENVRGNIGRNISGVINGAGISIGNLIVNKEINEFKSVVNPKIIGTYIMDKLTEDDDLKFFIMFSSLASFLRGGGLSDYVFGNTFLDLYADYRNAKGKKSLTINWPAWKDVGMAVDQKTNVDIGIFKSINSSKAIEAFDFIMKKDVPRVIISELDFSKKSNIEVDQLYFKLNEKIINKLNVDRNYSKTNKVMLKGKDDGNYTETEKRLAEIWLEILGVTEVSIYDNFYDVGGDSIQAIKITNSINMSMSKKIDMSDIFKYITIDELGRFLDSESISENVSVNSRISEVIDINDSKVNGNRKEYELSNAQKRIWFLQKLDPKLFAYNLVTRIEFNENINIDILNRAANTIISRYDSLRTIFIEENGVPKQRVLDSIEFTVNVVDISSRNDKYTRLEEMIDEYTKTSFDLSRPVIKMYVFKLGEEENIFFANIHHIVIDGWSFGMIMNELIYIYRSYQKNLIPDLKPIEKTYFDVVNKENTWKNTDQFKKAEEYWLMKLAKPLPELNLPIDYKRTEKQTYNGNFIKYKMNLEDSKKVKRLAAKFNVTPHILLLSIYFFVLNSITLDNDIIVGVPISNRDDKESEKIVGLLTNSIGIRINFSNLTTFEELVDSVKINSLEGYKNSKYPFDLLVEKINPERLLNRSPIYSTMFQYFENIPQESKGISQYELSLLCRDIENCIELRLEYNTDLFKIETAKNILSYIQNAIINIELESDVRLEEIKILSQEERRSIIEDFNSTKIEYDHDKSIGKIFEQQVERTPENVAVIYKDCSIKYKEINKKANQLISSFEKYGLKQGDIIGILMDRKPEMIIAILAALKYGVAYVPIDPTYPIDRIRYMLDDSNSKLLLSSKEIIDRLDINSDYIDILDSTQYFGNGKNINHEFSSDNLAYVIYTSGSTGKPKGVMIHHKAVNNFINGVSKVIDFSEGKRILNLTTISFDIFVLETLLPLTKGMGIVLADEVDQIDPNRICNLIINNNVNMMQITPSRMQLIISGKGNLECFKNIEEFMVGGEPVSEELLKNLKSLTFGKIYNMYGPTETTVWSTIKDLTNSEKVTIGNPIANTQIYILDKNNNIQPIGVVGELCIGGHGLAKGYLNNEILTDEKFVNNPFIEGGKIYKTGDLARILPDYEIECLGRIDYQVKLRGYRIELGEIENQLKNIDLIENCVVILGGNSEESCLVAYYVSNQEQEAMYLRNKLKKSLPNYMIPDGFVRVKELPLTPNGKIDKKKLPQYNNSKMISNNSYIKPRSAMEIFLANIWNKILKNKQIGIDDNFFDIGGNSLLLVQMFNKVDSIYPNKIEISDIFAYPTIREMTKLLDSKDKNQVEQIELRSVSFPSSFITDIEEESSDAILAFKLDEDILYNLQSISKKYYIKTQSLMLGAYIYLISEVIGENKIYIQTILGESSEISLLSIDIKSADTFLEYFRYIEEYMEDKELDKYPLEDVRRGSDDTKTSIRLLFTNNNELDYEKFDIFDLIILLRDKNDMSEAEFYYNSQKIKKDKVEVLIYAYIKVIKRIIERMI
ncbi:amino acid adenylation domain-containing protein [Clostridium sp. LP20]|uniref:amino acid adenylation domain-containing protein n=1 Tax=Clostridium sp. LP20 TaxID=3418665 RepID=UPI003EE6831B